MEDKSDETKIPEMENFFLGELGIPSPFFHEAIAESVLSLSFGQRGLLVGGESGRLGPATGMSLNAQRTAMIYLLPNGHYVAG